MASFSVTMENVSANFEYVILIMTVEITVMSRRQIQLFVVGVLHSFLIFIRILKWQSSRFRIACWGYYFHYDILIKSIPYGVLGKTGTSNWNHIKSISKLEKIFKVGYADNMQELVKRTGTWTTKTTKYIFLFKKFLNEFHLISGEKQKE